MKTALDAGAEPFELVEPVTLYTAHNGIRFHTWSDDECCLPQGATQAFLRDDAANRLRLRAGDVLVLQALASTTTGLLVDADHRQRHGGAARAVDPEAPLTDGVRGVPAIRRDPVTDQPFVEIAWDDGDALPFALCLSKRIGGALVTDMAGASANVALADHGGTAPRADDLAALPGGRVPRYPLDRTAIAPLTQQSRVKVAGSDQPVSDRHDGERQCRAGLRHRRRAPGARRAQRRRPAALECAARPARERRAEAAEFVVETENDGHAVLRFGDGVNGRAPLRRRRPDRAAAHRQRGGRQRRCRGDRPCRHGHRRRHAGAQPAGGRRRHRPAAARRRRGSMRRRPSAARSAPSPPTTTPR